MPARCRDSGPSDTWCYLDDGHDGPHESPDGMVWGARHRLEWLGPDAVAQRRLSGCATTLLLIAGVLLGVLIATTWLLLPG